MKDQLLRKVGFIIAAGGSGQRFGKNKLLENLKGIPLFLHSLTLLAKFTEPLFLVLVVNEQDKGVYEKAILQYRPELFDKVKIVIGGGSRQESVLKGLEALPTETDKAVVHDAARPFLTESVLLQALQLAHKKGNAVVAHRVVDTIKQVDAKGRVIATPPRETLRAVETPQIFPYQLLKSTLKFLMEAQIGVTDESSAINSVHPEYPIFLLVHEDNNRKITFQKDLFL